MEQESFASAEDQQYGQEGAQEQDIQGIHSHTPAAELIGNGINAGDIKKLAEQGYHTVEAIAYSTKRNLQKIKGVSDQKAEKLNSAGAHAAPFSRKSEHVALGLRLSGCS